MTELKQSDKAPRTHVPLPARVLVVGNRIAYNGYTYRVVDVAVIRAVTIRLVLEWAGERLGELAPRKAELERIVFCPPEKTFDVRM